MVGGSNANIWIKTALKILFANPGFWKHIKISRILWHRYSYRILIRKPKDQGMNDDYYNLKCQCLIAWGMSISVSRLCHFASVMIMNTVNSSKTTLLLVCMTPYTKRQQTSKSWRQRTECEGPFWTGSCRRHWRWFHWEFDKLSICQLLKK